MQVTLAAKKATGSSTRPESCTLTEATTESLQIQSSSVKSPGAKKKVNKRTGQGSTAGEASPNASTSSQIDPAYQAGSETQLMRCPDTRHPATASKTASKTRSRSKAGSPPTLRPTPPRKTHKTTELTQEIEQVRLNHSACV